MKNKAENEIISLIGLILFIIILIVTILLFSNNKTEKPLPKPELASGMRGVYGIDKNINENTIDNYLDRSDTVYRDLRMLVDTASWEKKGGDRYLSGFIRGFEIIPYPYLAGFSKEYRDIKEKENIEGLYEGPTLFTLNEDGTYTANYNESMDILEYIFPKDKNIILICGAGGYAGICKKMLVALGWDQNKIYNIGGYWYYKGKNNIQVKNTKNGEITYDFWKTLYHNIEFDKLHNNNK